MDVNPPLVQLGSRAALETVIENLTVLQAQIAELEESRSPSSVPGLVEMIEVLYSTLRDARDRNLRDISAILTKDPLAAPFDLEGLLQRLQHDIESAPEALPGVISPAW
jgi:hypothetical protein